MRIISMLLEQYSSSLKTDGAEAQPLYQMTVYSSLYSNTTNQMWQDILHFPTSATVWTWYWSAVMDLIIACYYM